MSKAIGVLVTIGAFAMCAAGAQASIVYEKAHAVYVADDAGKGAKLLAQNGREPGITPDGKTVLYHDAAGALYAVPAAGGAAVGVGAGINCAKRDACDWEYSLDNSAVALVDAKNVLHYFRLDGTAPRQLATGVASRATFSPDSTRVVFDHDDNADNVVTIAAITLASGVREELTLPFGVGPLWTTNGIVVTSAEPVGKKFNVLLGLVDEKGAAKGLLYEKKLTQKQLRKNLGVPIAFRQVPAGIVSFALGTKQSVIVRVIGFNGKVKTERRFKRGDELYDVTLNGRKGIAIAKKGKLVSVDLKTGKRKTLVSSGVKSAGTQ